MAIMMREIIRKEEMKEMVKIHYVGAATPAIYEVTNFD